MLWCLPGSVPLQKQDLGVPLLELGDVPVSPFLRLFEVPLDGHMTFWHVFVDPFPLFSAGEASAGLPSWIMNKWDMKLLERVQQNITKMMTF